MAWVDTFISLRGSTGHEGPIGPTGLGGGGIRTFATIYSDNDPSQGGLQSISRNVMPGLLTSPIVSQTFVPDSVVVDYAGSYYFTSKAGSVVYKVDRNGAKTTIIGTGTSGYYTGSLTSGYSISGTSFQLARPSGIAIDSTRTVLYVSDSVANFIVRYNILTQIASILDPAVFYTGSLVSGYVSKLNQPTGICLGKAPNGSGSVNDVLFIVNTGSHTIGQYTLTGTTRYNVIAGSGASGFLGDSAAATSARLTSPRDVCQVVGSSSQSIILIADTGNNRVRKLVITGGTETSGTITTVIGSGVLFNLNDNGTDPLANAVVPYGIQYAKGSDTVYITSDRRMRTVTNFTVGTPTLKTVIGQTINSTLDYLKIGGVASEASVSGLYGNVHIDFNGNIVTPGNATYPVLCYTTLRSIITLSPIPVLGDILNWTTRYDNGNGFQGVSQWVYNDYNSSIIAGETFDSTWIQIGSVVPVTEAGTIGVTGNNSTQTGHTGSDGPSERGPIGPTGDAQTQAPDGPAGPTGLVGITNYNDSVGPAGYDGPDGDIGPTGADGPSPEGPTGSIGRQGIQGQRHANFYQDLPFPQADTPQGDPFPATSLVGDYYIKSNTSELYHYTEAIPPNSYYLKRILNTSTGAFNRPGTTLYIGSFGTPVTQTNTATGAAGYDRNIPPGQTQAQRNTRYEEKVSNYNTAETYLYQYQSSESAVNFDNKSYELDSETAWYNGGGNVQLNGSITPWTTANSPFIYEFTPVPTSAIRTSYFDRNYYAILSINGTSIPGIYVVAGRKNPIFQETDTPQGDVLYIISMTDLSGNLPYVQYQIFWYSKTIPVSPGIPPSSVIAAYVGVAANKKASSTPSNPTGYDISLFFTNANYGIGNTVQFDTQNKLPEGCEPSMIYGLNGYPIIGSNPEQFAWTTKLHFGGLIELRLSVNIADVFSDSFSIPSNYGLYGLSNASTTEKNTPLLPNLYTNSLVTTVGFPNNDTSALPLYNTIRSNILYSNAIAVHPTTNDLYFTQIVRDSNGRRGETLLRLPSTSRSTDGYTYSQLNVIFSKDAFGNLYPDGTSLVNLGCEYISGMTFDNIGNLYYSDYYRNCVRKISLSTATPVVSTVAGVYPTISSNYTGGYITVGNNILLSSPRGLSCYNGYLYIADTNNNRVIRVDVGNRGQPLVIIGGGPPGSRNFPGLMDKTIGTISELLFNRPFDVKVDSSENLYISDSENHCVWRANLQRDEAVLFVGSWNYAGTPIPFRTLPPAPRETPWWEHLLTAISIVLTIAAIVLTGGGAAPAAAALASRGPLFTGTLAITREAAKEGFKRIAAVSTRFIPPVPPSPIIQGSLRGLANLADDVAEKLAEEALKKAAAEAAKAAATRYSLQVSTRNITEQVTARAVKSGVADAYKAAAAYSRTTYTTVGRTVPIF